MMCRLLIVLCLVLPSVAKACSCCQTGSFNLKEFDEAKVIVEIQVLSEIIEDRSKMFEDYALVLEKHKKSIMNWDKPYSPPPPMEQEFHLDTDFKIKVISYYKGMQYKISILRADTKTSCAWTPKIGQKYLIYISNLTTEGKTNIIRANACERRLMPFDKGYKNEKKTLKILKKAKNGQFEIYDDVYIGDKKHKFLVLEGGFKNKIRQGVWTLYEPSSYYEEVVRALDKTLILTYIDGKITDKKYVVPKNRFVSGSYTFLWNYYYNIEKN